ncbi:MAG: ATP-dependent protease ATPase subunit HslU [Christensenellaceae bacterium]|nr:ATP-dependent protease ATPase subunit HslU [Christensenellaceae bacterium]MDD6937874.1 ATP-dependent protease ATPase subunit HslU [Christensenellaceae bacterium]MDY2747844.1 ATP-dependent protease ATPase subunit HslU [Eubacteriales bacterium]
MFTPRETVEALDKYIVGQDEAKRAVAIALRNRYRRSRLSPEMREEITPKNIIMVGPTGVGKTEIARRLAKLVDAPLVKVEATKFTEVGYVGRDVDSIVRDLVEASIRLCKQKRYEAVETVAKAAAEQRLVELLMPTAGKKAQKPFNPIQLLLGSGSAPEADADKELSEEEKTEHLNKRQQIAQQLSNGLLENELVEIEVEQQNTGSDAMLAMGIDINLNEMMGGLIPKNKKKRRVKVSEARRILMQEESEKLIDMDEVIREAIEKAEQDGIVFIDEIDKIAGNDRASGPDVSREGVQRDILPIVEGCTVNTKYGPVKTDFMLFIAAGAFHVSKISDLIPELQGRFPIKVNLNPLTVEDYKRILHQPEHAITKQYEALLATDDVQLEFTDDALDAIARYAYNANETSENIGARRLHTIVENLLEDISFNAGGDHPMVKVVVDAGYVKEHMPPELNGEDLGKFIL